MSEYVNNDFNGLIRLVNIPVPNNLEILFGYKGDRRFVAIWFDLSACELCFCDGNDINTNKDGYWSSWYAYVTHPNLRIYFKPFNMGIYTDQPEHLIVLDRLKRSLYVGNKSDAINFIFDMQEIIYNQIDQGDIAMLLDSGSPLEHMQKWLTSLGRSKKEKKSVNND